MDTDNNDFTCNSFSIPELKYYFHIHSKPNNLSDILFANIRSLRKNFGDLLEMLESLDHVFSLSILNETCLEESEHDLFQIEGYDLFSAPCNRHGWSLLYTLRRAIASRAIDVY